MDNTPIIVGGIAAGLWALMSGKGTPTPASPVTPAEIAAQAVVVAQQQVANGVSPEQAAASAAISVQAQIASQPVGPWRLTWVGFSQNGKGFSISQTFNSKQEAISYQSILNSSNPNLTYTLSPAWPGANQGLTTTGRYGSMGPASGPNVPVQVTSVQVTGSAIPTGPILSVADPRLAQVAANKDTMFDPEVSAAGMPIDVRNALVAQGWTWTGSVFNPGSLYPPGTPASKIIMVA